MVVQLRIVLWRISHFEEKVHYNMHYLLFLLLYHQLVCQLFGSIWMSVCLFFIFFNATCVCFARQCALSHFLATMNITINTTTNTINISIITINITIKVFRGTVTTAMTNQLISRIIRRTRMISCILFILMVMQVSNSRCIYQIEIKISIKLFGVS